MIWGMPAAVYFELDTEVSPVCVWQVGNGVSWRSRVKQAKKKVNETQYVQCPGDFPLWKYLTQKHSLQKRKKSTRSI